MKICSAAEAAARLKPVDSLALPLGPGIPGAFLDALGERDDWKQLTVFAALLTQPHRLFTRSGVRLLSGFFGPVERALRAAGHDVQFVPADFRRFAWFGTAVSGSENARTATAKDGLRRGAW